MTNEEVNRTIHEAMGLCWHEDEGLTPWLTCRKCKVSTMKPDGFRNASYTSDWADYGRLLEWAKGKEWWSNYIALCWHNGLLPDGDFLGNLLSPLRGSTDLAEFIIANPK